MRLTERLLGYLNRVFDRDPKAFFALRIRYDGGMTWGVAARRLTTSVTGGVGDDLDIDLTAHTLRSLVEFIAAQDGYTVTYLDESKAGLNATVLLDGAGDQNASNGDRLFGYTSLLWSWLEAVGFELDALRAQIPNMLLQMNVNDGEGVWLDEIGGYYRVPRLDGEGDEQYGPRIIAETLRPRSNNNAIANAILTYTSQPSDVVDVVTYGGDFPLHDSVIDYDGSQDHSAGANPIYGLFDVQYGYDLVAGGDIRNFQDVVSGIVDRVRAAGTHLRSMALQGTGMSDALTPPSEVVLANAAAAMTDAVAAPTDAMTSAPVMLMTDDLADPGDDMGTEVGSTYRQDHSSLRSHDGKVTYAGNYLVTSPLESLTPTAAVKLLEDLYLYIAPGVYLESAPGVPLVWPR